MEPSQRETRDQLVRLCAGAILFVAVVAMFVLFFAVKICNQALAIDGTVRDVCRHPELSDPPAAAVALVAIVALGAFFTEISGFGISVKRQAAQAQVAAKEAVETASDARRAALSLEISTDDLAEGVRRALGVDLGLPTTPSDATHPEGITESTAAKVARLADRYNLIRMTMTSGPTRTAVMEEVMHQLTEALQEEVDFDVENYLRHKDRGMRLAAYAYAIAHPGRVDTHELVQAALAEDKPFGQFQALRALLRTVVDDPSTLTYPDRQVLADLAADRSFLGNRAEVLRRILEVPEVLKW